jgi:hypothetical protein
VTAIVNAQALEIVRRELAEALRHRTRRDLRWVVQYIKCELERSDITGYPVTRAYLCMAYDVAVAELDSRARACGSHGG